MPCAVSHLVTRLPFPGNHVFVSKARMLKVKNPHAYLCTIRIWRVLKCKEGLTALKFGHGSTHQGGGGGGSGVQGQLQVCSEFKANQDLKLLCETLLINTRT